MVLRCARFARELHYYVVSFVVVLTATTYLPQLLGDNQPVFMGPQFSTVFR